jgi:hypothetical protein
MSEATGIAVRRRRSKTEAERLVVEFDQSGMRRKALCAQRGLSVATLANYRKRCCSLDHRRPQSEMASSGMPPVEFVNMALAPAPAAESHIGFRVELANGRRIEVAPGFDATTLERLVVVLERA